MKRPSTLIVAKLIKQIVTMRKKRTAAIVMPLVVDHGGLEPLHDGQEEAEKVVLA